MRKNSILSFGLFALCVALGLPTFAQTYDQVANGNMYAKQAYYSLSTGTHVQVANDAWDLSFSALGQMDAGVHINESSSSSSTNPLPALEVYSLSVTDFSLVVQSTDLVNRVYNPETSWGEGALNVGKNMSNPLDMGWGVYNPVTHAIEGNRVWGVKLRNGAYKKFIVESLVGGAYTVKVADLDNGNSTTYTLSKSQANGSPVLYLSLTTGVVNTLPTSWDLVFQRYTTPLLDPSTGQYLPYNVLGVLSGKGVSVAKASGVNPQTVVFASYQDSLSADMDKIGYDWKYFSGTAWVLPSDVVYFVKTENNQLWKLFFVDFEGSSTGISTFEKTNLGTASSIGVEALEGKVWVFPTLTQSEINIGIESDKATHLPVNMYDGSGKMVWQTTVEATQNLVIHTFSLPALSAGMYHLHIGSNRYPVAIY